jgi:hypothetical protein
MRRNAMIVLKMGVNKMSLIDNLTKNTKRVQSSKLSSKPHEFEQQYYQKPARTSPGAATQEFKLDTTTHDRDYYICVTSELKISYDLLNQMQIRGPAPGYDVFDSFAREVANQIAHDLIKHLRGKHHGQHI